MATWKLVIHKKQIAMHDRLPSFVANQALKTRLDRCQDLPSSPVVATRILELSLDPAATLNKVAETVSLDPALTAKILRIANSSLYICQSKADNLDEAITRIGLPGVLTLVLSFSVVSRQQHNSSVGLDYNLFWRRAVVTAAGARQLGELVDGAYAEDLYLAGLLQDVGMLALDRVVPQLYREHGALQCDHRQLQGAEQGALGTDHAAVGAWLLERWNLPAQLVYAVAASHDPDALVVPPQFQTVAQCAAVAGDLADIYWSEDLHTALAHAIARARDWLGIERDTLSRVVEAVAEEARNSAVLFNVDVGDTALMNSLMEQAKAILMVRNLQALQETASLNSATESLESRTRELEEQNRRDPLTGLYNRAYLDVVLEHEFEVATAHGWPLALAFVDLDHFKIVNDTYGHQAGDKILREAAALLQQCARANDILARYGGEEFVLVLPGTGLAGVRLVCERLLHAFREARHSVGDHQEICVTTSVGIAIFGEGTYFPSIGALLRAADRALYSAKRAGRNREVYYRADLD